MNELEKIPGRLILISLPFIGLVLVWILICCLR